MKTLRIIFMGTPDFAVPALAALHESSHEVVCVYTQPPRPKGRGQKLQGSPVHEYADVQGIAVRTPQSLKGAPEQAEFAALKADVAVVAAYGLILPRAVLAAPRYGCLNIHASLLPRWRGASPIQRAIWMGDEKTGVTIMQMDEGLDTGGMIAKRAVVLTEKTTASSLHDELCGMGGTMILDVMDRLAAGEILEPEPQDNAQSVYAPLLTKEDGRIDWSKCAQEIDRQVRALNPWPGTFTGLFKIKSAVAGCVQTDCLPGTILDKAGHVACGGGTVLRLLQIQPAGKSAMDFMSALNGGYVAIGDVLR